MATSEDWTPPPYGGSPYYDRALTIPGTVRAHEYDRGGEGVAYHDTTPGNEGGACRDNTDVDLERTSAGGCDIGWIVQGEWLNYTVNVDAAGDYIVHLHVASPEGGGALHLGFNGPRSVWTQVSVPATGGWQEWTTISVPVTLGAGVQQITLLFDAPGFNIESMRVVANGSDSGGGTVTVPPGGDLQAAIDAAHPGDTILLIPGVTYAGSFTLRAKSGDGYVTIRSAAPDSALPPAGVRIGTEYFGQLPRVQGGLAGMPSFTTSPQAHHYRLQFLEIVNTYVHNAIIELGNDGSEGQTTPDVIPHDLVIDRCYIHGDPANGQKRGIALNSRDTTIVNSYISDIKSIEEDAQAIMAWNTPGHFTIENNYIEASGENILLGGADPAIEGMVPADVSFRFNYVTKQQEWRGQGWVTKNLIELKNAERVTIDSNVLEYSWAAAQQGYAVVLTPRNQDGTASWSVVQHIAVTNNVFRHVAAGFNVLGLDDSTYRVTNDVIIRNNLFVDISQARWGGNGVLLLTQGGSNIVVDHNTVFTDGTSVVYADGAQVAGFVFTNNILPDNMWAVMGGGASPGNGTISMYYPGADFRRNVLIGGTATTYPTDNYFPQTIDDVGFSSYTSGDYHLVSWSPYKAAGTDGLDIGRTTTGPPL